MEKRKFLARSDAGDITRELDKLSQAIYRITNEIKKAESIANTIFARSGISAGAKELDKALGEVSAAHKALDVAYSEFKRRG